MHTSQKCDSNFSVDELAKALFIVNRHAKTAPNSKFLYTLKHETIKKCYVKEKQKSAYISQETLNLASSN